MSRVNKECDKRYFQMQGHQWKCTTISTCSSEYPVAQYSHWKCTQCGTTLRVKLSSYETTVNPPTSFDLPREIRPLRCGDIIAQQVMES